MKADCHRVHRESVKGLLSMFSVAFVAGFCLILLTSCSLPNLEKPQCTDARLTVKRLYSYHFGNDMRRTPESLKGRQQFLTTELFNTLSAAGESDTDYFTATDKYPKAFRVGSCSSNAEDKAVLQVVLLWRTDTETDQKEVKVETIKTGDEWLVNKVTK